MAKQPKRSQKDLAGGPRDWLVTETASALLGGLRRFPGELNDPTESIPFHCLWMDYLKIAAGVPCTLAIAEAGVEPVCPSDTPRAWFAEVAIQIACGAHCDAAHDVTKFIRRLDHHLRTEHPDRHAEMGRLLREGWTSWLNRIQSLPAIVPRGLEDKDAQRAAQLASTLCDALRRQLPKSYKDINLALRVSNATGNHIVVGAATESDAAFDEPIPIAAIQAATSGYVQWSGDRNSPKSMILAVPCMVGQLPWAILYTSLRGERRQEEALCLYRDVLPSQLERIRHIAPQEYLWKLIGVVDTEMPKGGDRAEAMNAAWGDWGRIFPLRIPLTSARSAYEEASHHGAVSSLKVAELQNLNFPELKDEQPSQTWKDVGTDVIPMLEYAIRAREHISTSEEERLAEAVSHEIKNRSSLLAERSKDLHCALTFGASPESIRTEVEAVSLLGRHINMIALGLHSALTSRESLRWRPDCRAAFVLRAALRVALQLRFGTNQGFEIADDIGLEEAAEILRARFAPDSPQSDNAWETIQSLVNSRSAAILFFATGEPVCNVNIDRLPQRFRNGKIEKLRYPIKVWTRVGNDEQSTELWQETIEDKRAGRSFRSEGATRTNMLLPEEFCTIDPVVGCVEEPVPFDGLENAIRIKRRAIIRISGLP